MSNSTNTFILRPFFNTVVSIINYYEYLNSILLGSFILIFIHDFTKKNPQLQSSFFIITFVNIYVNFIWRNIYVFLSNDYSDLSYANILEFYTILSIIFDGWVLSFLSFNRFTAMVFPTKYMRIWSNRNTIVILFSVILLAGAYSAVVNFASLNDEETDILNILMYCMNLGSSIIGLILSILCIILKSSKIEKKELKAEKKLLIISFILVFLHFIVDIYSISVDYLSEMYPSLRFDLGEIADSIFVFFFRTAIFGLMGGVVILLLIIRWGSSKNSFKS